MKEITILSGKGGAGKTSITAALASLAENTVFCDNDVDAADLHLILQPEIQEEHTFQGNYIASINTEKCTACGICKETCRFDAIHYKEEGGLEINPFQCEGCRLCERICPVQAISSQRSARNSWYISTTRFGDMVHAHMGPGEENSGKLVSQVRKAARDIAIRKNADFIINDGPPGIGCSAISSITGTDIVLLVIEPSVSGLHDAERLLDLASSFNVKVVALINKADISIEISREIEKKLEAKNIPLMGRIPFNKDFVSAMIEGKSITEYNPGSQQSVEIKSIWENVRRIP